MDGALLHAPLHDDVPGPQAAELNDVPVDDDGPLPFDMLLGHNVIHVAPDEPVAALDDAQFDDEGWLPPDVFLGHPFHAAPVEDAPVQVGFTPPVHAHALEAFQDLPEVEDLELPPPQQALGNENMLGLTGMDQVGPQEPEVQPQVDAQIPILLPPALDAILAATAFLEHNHPDIADHPDGPGLVMALHIALADYIPVHDLPFNAQEPLVVPNEELPPLDGLFDVAVHPGNVEAAFGPWPGALDNDDDIEVEAVNEDDDLPNQLDAEDVLWMGELPAVQEPVPGIELVLARDFADAAPDAVIAVEDEVMEDDADANEQEEELHALPQPAAGAEANLDGGEPAVAVGLQVDLPDAALPLVDEEGDDGEEQGEAVNVGEQAPVPNVEATEDVDNETEHEAAGAGGAQLAEHAQRTPSPIPEESVQDRTISEGVASTNEASTSALGLSTSGAALTLHTMAQLDVGGRAALSSLCTRFGLVDDPMSLNRVLLKAVARIDVAETSLHEHGSPEFFQPKGGANSAPHLNRDQRTKNMNRMSKLREVWKRTFSRSPVGASGKARATSFEVDLVA